MKVLWMLALAISFGGARSSRGDDWPQWQGPRRDGVWRETGILDKFPESGLRIRWRAPVGSGYSSPAVAGARVFLTDRKLSTGARNPANPFDRSSIPGIERVTCFDDANGRPLWQFQYDCPYTVSYPAGPRAMPLVAGGRVYTLGAEGDLYCLRADNGQAVWAHHFKKEFGATTPTWGFASHPLLYGNKLICLVGGAPGQLVMAFDSGTGREVWRALSASEPGYAPPTLIHAAGKDQLIIWDPGAVHALDPETGEIYWQRPFRSRSGLCISTPRQDGDRLFVTTFYNGSLMLRLASDHPGAATIWRSVRASEIHTDGLHSIISTPFLQDGYIYGVCSYGQLRCLKADTGERLWETLRATTLDGKETRWANAFLIKHDDRFFLFNEKGDLILARLSPKGYSEISRAHLIDPINHDPGRAVVWCHPAFAHRSVYVRNDAEMVCASLAAP